MQQFLLTCAALTLVAGAAKLPAAEWGDLTGSFVLSGDVPIPPPIAAAAAVCGPVIVVDESLIVGPKKGIKNIVVYLYLKDGEQAPAAHEDYAKTAKDEVSLDNDKCRFEPHITLLRTTQTLAVGNKDGFPHSVKIDPLENVPVSVIVPAGGAGGVKVPFVFPKSERLPSNVSCAIHPWMNAKVLVRDNPYFAVTDENGKFTIKKLPAGKWTFQFWHEKAGYIQKELKQVGKPLTWAKGRTDVTIDPKGTDLGTVEVGLAGFKR